MSAEAQEVKPKADPLAARVPASITAPKDPSKGPSVSVGKQYAFADDVSRIRPGVNRFGQALDKRFYYPLKPNERFRDEDTVVDIESGRVVKKLRWGGPRAEQRIRNQGKGFGAVRGTDNGAIEVAEMTLLERSPEDDRISNVQKVEQMCNQSRSVSMRETCKREGLLPQDAKEEVDPSHLLLNDPAAAVAASIK